MTPTRRRFLAAGVTGLAASSAGCLSTLPPLGQEIRYGRVDVPDSAPPEYRRWVPATDALEPYHEHDVSTHLTYGIPGAMGRELLDRPVGFARSFQVGLTDYVGIDYETYEHGLRSAGVFVGEKDVDRTVVEATLDGTGFERDGSYEGYRLYTRTDGPRVVAVGESAVVNARDDSLDNALGRVETTIDAGAGRIQRRHEADDAFRAITDIVGARPFTWPGVGALDLGDSLISATSATFDSDAVYFVWDDLYESAGATPSREEIKRHLEEENRAQQSMQTDIEIDGRVVSVQMRLSAEKFRADASEHTTPHITWGVDDDADAGRLTFRHEAGESVPRSQLEIVPEYGYRGSPPFDEAGTFGPGDSVTLDLTAEADDTYRIEWHAPDGGSMTRLFDYDREAES